MHPERTSTEKNETPASETEENSSSLQSDSPVETEEGFEEVDFSELTSFADGNEQDETPAVETVSKDQPDAPEDDSSEEVAVETADATDESESDKAEETEVKAKEEAEKEAPKKKEAVEETPAEPEVKMPTKEELEGMYKEHREKTLPTLEQMFTLSEEEAAALDEQPSKVLPKMAGQMMYDTMMSTYNAVIAAMPSVVNRLIVASNQANQAEQQFFDRWPDLNEPAAKPVVQAAISAYRSANPRAKFEDVVQNAGVMAMINLGKDPLAVKTQQAAPTTQTKKPAPARPAAPRGTTQTTPPKKPGSEPENEFTALAEAFARDNF